MLAATAQLQVRGQVSTQTSTGIWEKLGQFRSSLTQKGNGGILSLSEPYETYEGLSVWAAAHLFMKGTCAFSSLLEEE